MLQKLKKKTKRQLCSSKSHIISPGATFNQFANRRGTNLERSKPRQTRSDGFWRTAAAAAAHIARFSHPPFSELIPQHDVAYLPASTLGLMADSSQSIAATRSWFSVPPVSGSCSARIASGTAATGIDRRKWCTDAWCSRCKTAHPGRSTPGSTRTAAGSILRRGGRNRKKDIHFRKKCEQTKNINLMRYRVALDGGLSNEAGEEGTRRGKYFIKHIFLHRIVLFERVLTSSSYTQNVLLPFYEPCWTDIKLTECIFAFRKT